MYKCTGSPPLPPPVVVSFRFDPDHQDMVNVTWIPVSLVGHPGISVNGYYVEVSRNRNGSDIVANGTAAAGDTSFVLSVGEYSDKYWVRIKAVQGNLDASGFSDWFAIDAVLLLPISGVCTCVHILLSAPTCYCHYMHYIVLRNKLMHTVMVCPHFANTLIGGIILQAFHVHWCWRLAPAGIECWSCGILQKGFS